MAQKRKRFDSNQLSFRFDKRIDEYTSLKEQILCSNNKPTNDIQTLAWIYIWGYGFDSQRASEASLGAWKVLTEEERLGVSRCNPYRSLRMSSPGAWPRRRRPR
jgi:hypothetical protein